MAKLSKPKEKKLPKRPKKSASLAIWEKYNDKVKDILKYNKKRLAEYNKAVSDKKSDAKKKESIMAGIGKLK